jgi:uncharacterized phage protein (TIGR01671 family)
MGRIWIENKGLGLFRARRKNSRKWLEGYYVRVLETAGYHSPAFCHYIIFQETDSGRVCRAEISPDTLCRCTGVRDKNNRLIFEHDIVRREIWNKDVIGEVVWSDIGLTGFFLEAVDKNQKGVSHSYPISRGSFDDDEWNANTDEVIGNIFDCPIC